MNTIALKAAFRHLKKHIGFTAFNGFGLTLGFLSFFFISIFVIDELSYDSFNANKNEIFRIESELKIGGNTLEYAIAPPGVGANVSTRFPEVIASCRLFPERGNRFENSN